MGHIFTMVTFHMRLNCKINELSYATGTSSSQYINEWEEPIVVAYEVVEFEKQMVAVQDFIKSLIILGGYMEYISI